MTHPRKANINDDIRTRMVKKIDISDNCWPLVDRWQTDIHYMYSRVNWGMVAVQRVWDR